MSDEHIIDILTFMYATDNEAVVPGTVMEVAGKKYRFVQNGASDTATSGYPLCYVGTDFQAGDWDVTADLSDSVADGVFAGVAIADMAVSEYGWILIDGIYETCTMNAAVTVGNAVIADATADGGFDPADANGLIAIAGVAIEVAADTATGVAIWIKGL